ncbi:hypothetical protein [Chryseobacterium soldanellicola]|uniref:hypothetical protein n=1 Tax=Chryseobacterium soldanellicola TaxID=311333 RepID=UPI00147E7EF6|nr:hypothetical protein [Chryseobacterium soldanellicola]
MLCPPEGMVMVVSHCAVYLKGIPQVVGISESTVLVVPLSGKFMNKLLILKPGHVPELL